MNFTEEIKNIKAFKNFTDTRTEGDYRGSIMDVKGINQNPNLPLKSAKKLSNNTQPVSQDRLELSSEARHAQSDELLRLTELVKQAPDIRWDKVNQATLKLEKNILDNTVSVNNAADKLIDVIIGEI